MNKLAVIYKRAPETRGAKAPYEDKFAGFIKACKKCKSGGVSNLVVTWPWVIGDTYEEMIESLSRLADVGVVLHIVERDTPDEFRPAKISRN